MNKFPVFAILAAILIDDVIMIEDRTTAIAQKYFENIYLDTKITFLRLLELFIRDYHILGSPPF